MKASQLKAKTHASQKEEFLFFTVAFVLSLFICVSGSASYLHNRIQLECIQMEQIAISRANKIKDVLSNLLYKTQVLRALVVQNNGSLVDFEKISATILDSPAIKNLLLAPDGIVTHVYPLEGNDAVLGLDFFSESMGNKEAVLAKQTGQLVLGGPFSLIQGGEALVGRLPIYTQDNEFWGLSSVTLNYPQALEGAELDQLAYQGFAYEIWRINPDTGENQVIAQSNYSYNRSAGYVEYPMNILNAQWYFRLSPIRAWYQFPETWILGVLGVIVSFLIGLLVRHNRILSNMKMEFENLSLIDPLTGIYNRRGGFQVLQSAETMQTPFILCYMDLDSFKEINDRYGHNIGDLVLQKFVKVLNKQMQPYPFIFARMGGDEFLLVRKDTHDLDRVKSEIEQVHRCLTETDVDLNGLKISIPFSVGYICFPEDGTNIDELLVVADERMYTYKKHTHFRASTRK